MTKPKLKPLDLATPDLKSLPGQGANIWCCGGCNKLFRSLRGPRTPDAAPTAKCPRCGWLWVPIGRRLGP